MQISQDWTCAGCRCRSVPHARPSSKELGRALSGLLARCAVTARSGCPLRIVLRMTATIIRPLTGRLQIRNLHAPRKGELPNKTMFRNAAGSGIRPTWVAAADGQPGWAGYWTIARTHLTDVAEIIAIRDGAVEIEMHYNTTEKCDGRCTTAERDECTCSCEGKNHGQGHHAGWLKVGDTTLVRGGGKKVVKRRLTGEEARVQRDTRTKEMWALRGIQG